MIQQVRCSACGNLHRIEINAISNRLQMYECPKTHQRVIFYPNISQIIAVLKSFNPSNRESK